MITIEEKLHEAYPYLPINQLMEYKRLFVQFYCLYTKINMDNFQPNIRINFPENSSRN